MPSWDSLLAFCKNLPLAAQETNETLQLIKLDDALVIVQHLVIITNDFHVNAQKGSQKFPVRHLLHSSSYKLSRYSEITNILDFLENSSFKITSDLHAYDRGVLIQMTPRRKNKFHSVLMRRF